MTSIYYPTVSVSRESGSRFAGGSDLGWLMKLQLRDHLGLWSSEDLTGTEGTASKVVHSQAC